jgi:hypothetical protein
MAYRYATTTPITLELNVDEAVYNAVVWCESSVPGEGRESGKTVVKE